ncbi:MAG TPA: hypothetical protein IGS52_08330 [Oscillatoriaceae cyanobacterium M33_DOE_052]|uniref:Uncharacterized protein n=1 Tax=Planktothricoides sp. SpSt-374 TaxID=2282167 RepID=A0A7C3ZK71_9CYAN|nr:hypothetical protein [Oscillatoriaceae cyanobacterium M33_DOE_052]
MSKKLPLIQIFQEDIKEGRWIDIAALSISGLGTILALVLKNAIYATPLLTAAIWLNILANRYRKNDPVVAAVAETSIPTEPPAAAPVEPFFLEQFDSVSPAELEVVQRAIYQLQDVTKRLEQTALKQEDWEVMNVRLLMVQEAITQQVERMTGRKKDEMVIAERGEVSSDIGNNLADRIAKLEQKNQDIIKPYLLRLSNSLKQLRQKQMLADIREDFQSLKEQFQNRPELQKLEKLQEVLDLLAVKVERVDEYLRKLPPPPAPVDISRMEDVMLELDRELRKLQQDVVQHLLRGEKLMRRNMSQLKQSYAIELQHLPPLSRVEDLETALADVTSHLERLESQISQLLLQATSTEPDSSSARFLTLQDIAPLVATVKKLQQHQNAKSASRSGSPAGDGVPGRTTETQRKQRTV